MIITTLSMPASEQNVYSLRVIVSQLMHYGIENTEQFTVLKIVYKKYYTTDNLSDVAYKPKL